MSKKNLETALLVALRREQRRSLSYLCAATKAGRRDVEKALGELEAAKKIYSSKGRNGAIYYEIMERGLAVVGAAELTAAQRREASCRAAGRFLQEKILGLVSQPVNPKKARIFVEGKLKGAQA